MNNHFDFPLLGYGVGLRPPHYSYILENKPDIDWFEIISENYMDTDGRPSRMLDKILENYPVVMHGVSLSIGTIDPLNSEYLKKLKVLAERVNPAWISDHLCWTGIAHKNTHDLLPVPYTEEALAHIIDRIKRVQDVLGRPITLENPSTYLEFSSSSMPEWEFIARMAEEANCALLLDANNIYVSCYNHNWDPQNYIDSLPLNRVVQIHLAGHTNKGTHIIDTHDDHVIDEVWNLYGYIINCAGRQISTMVEWDDNIPDFPIVLEEVNKARKWGKSKKEDLVLPRFSSFNRNKTGGDHEDNSYAKTLDILQSSILDGDAEKAEPESWIIPKSNFTPSDQLNVYIDGYRFRLFDIVYEDYPALRNYLGRKKFNDLVDDYIEVTPSSHFNIARYTQKFLDFVKPHIDPFAYELCVLETSISQLYDEVETPPLSIDNIQDMTPEIFMKSKISGRRAMVLLPFAWNVNAYFNDIMADVEPKKPHKKSTYVAVYRHNDQMWRLDLEENEYMLLSGLFSDLPVEKAMAAVLPKSKNEDELAENISTWFSRWVNNGLLTSVAS